MGSLAKGSKVAFLLLVFIVLFLGLWALVANRCDYFTLPKGENRFLVTASLNFIHPIVQSKDGVYIYTIDYDGKVSKNVIHIPKTRCAIWKAAAYSNTIMLGYNCSGNVSLSVLFPLSMKIYEFPASNHVLDTFLGENKELVLISKSKDNKLTITYWALNGTRKDYSITIGDQFDVTRGIQVHNKTYLLLTKRHPLPNRNASTLRILDLSNRISMTLQLRPSFNSLPVPVRSATSVNSYFLIKDTYTYGDPRWPRIKTALTFVNPAELEKGKDVTVCQADSNTIVTKANKSNILIDKFGIWTYRRKNPEISHNLVLVNLTTLTAFQPLDKNGLKNLSNVYPGGVQYSKDHIVGVYFDYKNHQMSTKSLKIRNMGILTVCQHQPISITTSKLELHKDATQVVKPVKLKATTTKVVCGSEQSNLELLVKVLNNIFESVVNFIEGLLRAVLRMFW